MIAFEHESYMRKKNEFFFSTYISVLNIILFIDTLWQNAAINVAEWCSMCKRIIFGTSHKNCIWLSQRTFIFLTISLHCDVLDSFEYVSVSALLCSVLHVSCVRWQWQWQWQWQIRMSISRSRQTLSLLNSCANFFDQSAHHLSHKCFGIHIYLTCKYTASYALTLVQFFRGNMQVCSIVNIKCTSTTVRIVNDIIGVSNTEIKRKCSKSTALLGPI